MDRGSPKHGPRARKILDLLLHNVDTAVIRRIQLQGHALQRTRGNERNLLSLWPRRSGVIRKQQTAQNALLSTDGVSWLNKERSLGQSSMRFEEYVMETSDMAKGLGVL